MSVTRKPAAVGMNPTEFANISATEDSFWWFRGMDRMLWDFLSAHQDCFREATACEVGCGTGWVSSQFRARYPSCSLASLDLEAEGLRYARQRGLQRLLLADVRHLPLAGERFQLLMALDVIAHLAPGEEGLALAEFARVLAPGGLLVLRTSAFDWLRSRHSAFVHEQQRYSIGKLELLLAPNGLNLVRSTYANSLLLPLALFKFRVVEALAQAEPASGLHAINPLLNATLEQFLRLEAAWLRAGCRLPVGQSLWLIARKKESGIP